MSIHFYSPVSTKARLRSTLLAALGLALAFGCNEAPPPDPVFVPAGFVVEESADGFSVSGAEPGAELALLDASGEEIDRGTVNAAGGLDFFGVPLAEGYVIEETTGLERERAESLSAIATDYSEPGPYTVGVLTLPMADRNIEVFYPAAPGSEAGQPFAAYELIAPFPTEPINIQALILSTAPEVNSEVVLPAYRDLPGDSSGPFPMLIFSHGSGGFREAYSQFLANMASHGFVVGSLDVLEFGLLARLGLGPPEEDQRTPQDLVDEAMALLEATSDDNGSLLAGTVDAEQVATLGHSAGGRVAFAFLTERQQIKTHVGYATVPFEGTPTLPVLLLLGAEDEAITPATTLAIYDPLAPPKRYVAVGAAGHNSFTDQCEIIYNGNDVIAAAQAIFGEAFPDSLAELARDGCREENMPPSEFWKIAQHYTVAHLKYVFGENSQPLGLETGALALFPEADIDYRFSTPAPEITAGQVTFFNHCAADLTLRSSGPALGSLASGRALSVPISAFNAGAQNAVIAYPNLSADQCSVDFCDGWTALGGVPGTVQRAGFMWEAPNETYAAYCNPNLSGRSLCAVQKNCCGPDMVQDGTFGTTWEFTPSGAADLDYADISTNYGFGPNTPPNLCPTGGPDDCVSAAANIFFNVPIKWTSNQTCSFTSAATTITGLQCLEASCPDAYQYPTDDKQSSCPSDSGRGYLVEYCPDGQALPTPPG